MPKLVKHFLIPALLLSLCAYAGLRGARGQRTTPGVRGGVVSLVLKNLTLTRMDGSTVLKGDVVNVTNRGLEGATYEVKAYGPDGTLLKGSEEKTLLRVGRLEPNASAAINSGYGVWLQGIPREAIATVEVYEAADENRFPAHAIPLADHALFWKEYSNIEE